MKTKEKTKKETGASIAETMKEIRKKFGEDSVMMLDQNTTMKVEVIPTGSFGLDMALGVGGYPLGRVVEISGPESSGKTTLALHAVAEAQKTNGVCAYIDTEHALDPLYAKSLGIDTKSLLISQPEHGEQALDMVETMVRSGKFAVIVIDSVASLVPKAEIEGDMGDPQVGRHAKLMSHALRKLIPLISTSKTVVIFINQIRQMIGVTYGPTEFTTGGKALKFFSSVRIDIRRIAQIKKGEEIVGGRTRVKVTKNKVAPPYKQTEFDIMYGEGISREGEILAVGEKLHLIQREGHTYSYAGKKIGRGYADARQELKKNPELAKKLIEEIRISFNQVPDIIKEVEFETAE
jgi:recombination protein RecA